MRRFNLIFFSFCYFIIALTLLWFVNFIFYWIVFFIFPFYTSISVFPQIGSLILGSILIFYVVFFGAIKISKFLNEKIFGFFPKNRTLLILITIVAFADAVWNMIWLTPIPPLNDMSVAYLKLLLIILAFSLRLVVSPLNKIWNKIMTD
jgi:hypothetical protein